MLHQHENMKEFQKQSIMEKQFDYDVWCSYTLFEAHTLQSPNLIYGAGNFGQSVCRALQQHNLPVIGFLDRRATSGMVWQGVPIYPPDWQGAPSDVNVLLALHNREVALLPVVADLQQRGYTKIILPMQFYDVLGDAIGDAYWLGERGQYARWREEIEAADELWADAVSRQWYRAVLRFRLGGDLVACPRRMWHGNTSQLICQLGRHHCALWIAVPMWGIR